MLVLESVCKILTKSKKLTKSVKEFCLLGNYIMCCRYKFTGVSEEFTAVIFRVNNTPVHAVRGL